METRPGSNPGLLNGSGAFAASPDLHRKPFRNTRNSVDLATVVHSNFVVTFCLSGVLIHIHTTVVRLRRVGAGPSENSGFPGGKSGDFRSVSATWSPRGPRKLFIDTDVYDIVINRYGSRGRFESKQSSADCERGHQHRMGWGGRLGWVGDFWHGYRGPPLTLPFVFETWTSSLLNEAIG